MFFATTEDLESSFLTTFIRRIPIQIELPTLESRGRKERLELVYSFLVHEQRKLKKNFADLMPSLNFVYKWQF